MNSFTVLCAGVLGLGVALTNLGTAGQTDGAKPFLITVHYLNGSTVHMALVQEQIEVETAFGKLTVPRGHIRSIDFGVRLDDEDARQIDEFIGQLGDPLYKRRELALHRLIELGAKAHPALQRAAAGKDAEVVNRAKRGMEAIEKKVPARLLKRRTDDIIKTDRFTIVGKIVTPALAARAEYFGELKLRPIQLYSLRSVGGGGEVEVVVDAATHGSANGQWLETDYHVNAEERLTFVTTGQVDLWPQGPGQYMATPDGKAGTLFAPYSQTYGPQAAVSGALIGRIGENGRPFLVGSRLSRSFDQGGKLFVHIVPSPWNNASSGTYRLRIVTGGNSADGE